jgi:hypothetical protein
MICQDLDEGSINASFAKEEREQSRGNSNGNGRLSSSSFAVIGGAIVVSVIKVIVSRCD